MMASRKTVVLTTEDRYAWAKLQRQRPEVDWIKASLRRADLTGEGKPSCVMVGDGGESAWVGIVRPGREGPTNPTVFAAPPSMGLAFLAMQRTEDFLVDGVFPLAGCRPRRGMNRLTITDAAGNSITIYWNADTRRFDAWWRGMPAA
jgi:hypothetical protein